MPVAAGVMVLSIMAPAGSAWAAPAAAVPAARPVAGAAPVDGVGVQPLTAADPFGGRVPGDVSDGRGVLPPVQNPAAAGRSCRPRCPA